MALTADSRIYSKLILQNSEANGSAMYKQKWYKRKSGGNKKPGQVAQAGFATGVPKGIRTPVAAVKGQCPRPLDDGDRLLCRLTTVG